MKGETMDISQFNQGMELFERNHLGVSRTAKEPDVVSQMPRQFIFFDNLPGWTHTDIWNYTTPRMNADFVIGQLELKEGGGTLAAVHNDCENFFYLVSGAVTLRFAAQAQRLERDGYGWLPPGTAFEMSQEGTEPARVLWVKKKYAPLAGAAVPAALTGQAADLPAAGDTAEQTQECLPAGADYGFDISVNILTYHPGVTSGRTRAHMSALGAYVLGGRGELVVNGAHYEAHENDYFYIAPCAPHYTVAYAPAPLRIFVFEEVNRDYAL